MRRKAWTEIFEEIFIDNSNPKVLVDKIADIESKRVSDPNMWRLANKPDVGLDPTQA